MFKARIEGTQQTPPRPGWADSHQERSPPWRDLEPDASDMTTAIAIRSSPSPIPLEKGNTFAPRRASYPSTPLSHTAKPKLSLDTVCAQRKAGRVNTGLRLDTLSAVSPTLRNTYKNSYDPPAAPGTPFCAVGSSFPASSDSRLATELPSPKPPTPHLLQTPAPSSPTSESPSSSPACSSSSVPTPCVPYSRSCTLHSILVNGPLPRQGPFPNPAHSPRKEGMAFATSPGKRVAFRQQNLTEEITTAVYIVPHYDLCQDNTPSPISPSKGSPRSEARTGDKRDSPSDDDLSDKGNESDESTAYPKTPIAGRRKRRREWAWTLGPPSGTKGNENGDSQQAAPFPESVADLEKAAS